MSIKNAKELMNNSESSLDRKARRLALSGLEAALEHNIPEGIVNIPYVSGQYDVQRVKLQEADHPVLDEAGEKGVRCMLGLVSSADEKDLVICLISGGGSSLMPLPRSGISLQNKRVITDLLLKSGAAINEINAVRKHISGFKGDTPFSPDFPSFIE